MPDTSAVVGEIIELPVYVDSSLSSESVLAYQLQISFDATLLQVNSVSVSGLLGEPFGLPAVNLETPGQLTVAAAGVSPLEGSGVLVVIRFETLQAGESPVLFWDEEANFFNEGTPALLLIDGSIAISPLVATRNLQLDPPGFVLHQNFPNPFNPGTTIHYTLADQAAIMLSIFDIQGREINKLYEGIRAPGNYTVKWDGNDQQGHAMRRGVYLCRLLAGKQSKTIRMVYLP